MEAFVCVRETPSGGYTGMLAFADHLHAHKPIFQLFQLSYPLYIF